MNILGISCFYHDAAAALLQDGMLTATAEEERLTRKKHDSDFPINTIRFCLKQGGIRAGDLDYVVFYEKPFLKFERILQSTLQGFPKSWGLYREAMLSWLLDKLWVKSMIHEKVGVDEKKVLFSEHHLSHAASAFFCSPFDEAAILTADAVGEWATTTLGIGKGTEIKLLRELRFPHSIGLLYSTFTAFLGFEVNEGEYKVMGMAPYGQPRYMDKVYQLMDVSPDGSFHLNMDYFEYHYSLQRTFSRKFLKLFGDPRPLSNRDKLDPYYADIAASIQVVTEEILLKMANALHKETGLTRLCLAGGVALNSVANGRILKETPFKELYIQPAAGDGGGSLGAALYAYHAILGKPRRFVMDHAYWGQEHSQGSVEDFLKTQNIAFTRLEDEDKLVDRVVELLTKGKVVGWSRGKFEFGPRALGNRSILADPRRPEMKDIVNRKIKFREAFRPFAPSVLMEDTQRFFCLPEPPLHLPARFMLLVVPVQENQREVIPAVTHVDGSARLQTVAQATNPLYYKVIQRFGEATGVPVLLNTSFNLKGEPIVNSPGDACKTFFKSEMDAMVLDSSIILK